jgi:hypothetical protein
LYKILVVSIAIACVIISGCTVPQTSQKGTLAFSSTPTGAEIYLDNQYRGTTPSVLADIPTGNHSLEFRYPGYTSWTSVITVPQGLSNYFAALTPKALPVTTQTTAVPVVIVSASAESGVVTIRSDKSLITIGSTITFSGTGPAGQNVPLVMYGPGAYVNGVELIPVSAGSDGRWSYTWNPGSKLQAGSYTMVANNVKSTESARADFSVVGGGLTSITTGRYTYGKGDTFTFSGQCTTGSRNVLLTLYGPGQFTNGASLGMVQVGADNTWSFSYPSSNSMPLGTYTISVQDEQQISSNSVSFTLANSG